MLVYPEERCGQTPSPVCSLCCSLPRKRLKEAGGGQHLGPPEEDTQGCLAATGLPPGSGWGGRGNGPGGTLAAANVDSVRENTTATTARNAGKTWNYAKKKVTQKIANPI